VQFVSHTWPRFPEVAELRYQVLQAPFGVERDDDWNDADRASRHLVAISEDGSVVGYARLIVRGDAQIRQVAVDEAWQMTGVGRALVTTLVRQARADGLREIWLNARLPAIGFYERLGFEAVGGTFNTGRTSLPHRRMEYRGPSDAGSNA
jgi:ribosomal protein S18 acetylase RimI-like enzyme